MLTLSISIFDFDGTLFQTPHPSRYKEVFGENYKNNNWWADPISLDLKRFNIRPNCDIVEKFFRSKTNPFEKTIILTGRNVMMKNSVSSVLNFFGLCPDELILCDQKDILDFKLKMLDEIIKCLPFLERIKMFEDKPLHAEAFERWGKTLNLDFSCRLIYSPESIREFIAEISKKP